jgi:hypothetical protein
MHLLLPEFAYWSLEDWGKVGHEADEIRECRLGWDVTDFGRADFANIGRTLFTLRNGRHNDPKYRKPYAEKFIYNPEGQKAPLHFHRSKMEDIINRGGGNVLMKLYKAGDDDYPSDESFVMSISGISRQVGPGEIVRIKPGESIALPPRICHSFWGEEGTGPSVSGEVSTVCDDLNDNFFIEDMKRFPPIDEDEPARYVLCGEYASV